MSVNWTPPYWGSCTLYEWKMYIDKDKGRCRSIPLWDAPHILLVPAGQLNVVFDLCNDFTRPAGDISVFYRSRTCTNSSISKEVRLGWPRRETQAVDLVSGCTWQTAPPTALLRSRSIRCCLNSHCVNHFIWKRSTYPLRAWRFFENLYWKNLKVVGKKLAANKELSMVQWFDDEYLARLPERTGFKQQRIKVPLTLTIQPANSTF